MGEAAIGYETKKKTPEKKKFRESTANVSPCLARQQADCVGSDHPLDADNDYGKRSGGCRRRMWRRQARLTREAYQMSHHG